MWGHFTSILRLIEVRFNVPSLAARDASADDMMEFFAFPHLLSPPALPPQPTNGVCDFNKEKPLGFRVVSTGASVLQSGRGRPHCGVFDV
jgi:hypothetical protein